MSYLLDTGILLRLADRRDPQYAVVFAAVNTLIGQGEELLIATQNTAEFCNVATRPVANNGLGLAPKDALDLLEHEIEPICSMLAEPPSVYAELKRLIAKYSIIGKQVHDARLVAMMLVWKIGSVLTLNDRDFRRNDRKESRLLRRLDSLIRAGNRPVPLSGCRCTPPYSSSTSTDVAILGFNPSSHSSKRTGSRLVDPAATPPLPTRRQSDSHSAGVQSVAINFCSN